MKPVYMLCVNLNAQPRSHSNIKHRDANRRVSFAFMHIFKHSCVSVLVTGCVRLPLLELLCSSCCCKELEVSIHYHSSALDQLLRRRPPLGPHTNDSTCVRRVHLDLDALKDVLIKDSFVEGEEERRYFKNKSKRDSLEISW